MSRDNRRTAQAVTSDGRLLYVVGMLIQFPALGSGRDPVWVNTDQVTHVEQIGVGQQRAKIHFVGGSEIEVARTAADVTLALNKHLGT
jgi:hypothetical protein